MITNTNFPEIPKVLISNDFQPYLKGSKKPAKLNIGIKHYLNFVRSEPFKLTRYTPKVTSTALGIHKNLIPNDAVPEASKAIQEASKIVSTLSGALSLFSSFVSVISLVRILKKKEVKKEDQQIRRWKITKFSLDIINSFTSFLGILDRFKVIELAKITATMARISEVGNVFARVFSSSVVFSFFSITSSNVSIVISVLKIKKIWAKLSHAKEKIKKTWSTPIDRTLAEKKIERIPLKQEEGIARAKELKAKIEKMEPSLQTLGQNYEGKKAALQLKKTFKHKIALKVAKMKYKKGIKKYKPVLNEMKALKKSHMTRTENGKKWQAILEKFQTATLTESETASLEKMREEKLHKWKAKKINELFALAKQGSKICLSLISIALSVTSIALTIIFPGAIPVAALITLSVISLAAATASLIKTFYFNRVKKRAFQSVSIPDFRT